MIKAVIFDFGGVLAEEAFKEGLKAIGRKYGLDPDPFFEIARELVYQTGYVTGMSDEPTYWKTLREKTGIKETDEDLREEVLKRFIVRPEMINDVDKLKSSGLVVAILSDQTNWLDEIDQERPFYHHFDHIFNSFHLKKSKRDPSVFKDICSILGLNPEEVLFVDDNMDNIRRASDEGLKTVHFKGMNEFEKEIERFIPLEEAPGPGRGYTMLPRQKPGQYPAHDADQNGAQYRSKETVNVESPDQGRNQPEHQSIDDQEKKSKRQ